MRKTTSRKHSGFSLIELIVTMGLFGLLCVVAASNISVLENPLVSASANLSHYLRLVRVRAISQTRSILIEPVSTSRLSASTAANCAAETFTPIDDLDFELGGDVYLSPTDWSVCFTQRGVAQQGVSFTLNSDNGSRTVEIALGGGVEIN